MHRLEPVARIRQRAVHDGGERIGEIALLQRLAQRDFLDAARIGGNHFLVHGTRRLARLRRRNKACRERGDKACARFRQGQAARRKGVPVEKKSGEREGVGKIGRQFPARLGRAGSRAAATACRDRPRRRRATPRGPILARRK